MAGRDRATDGPEWMTAAQVAEFLGIEAGTWRAYVSRSQAPQADDPELDRPAGKRMPRWKRSTVVAWRDARPGQGNRTNKLDGTRK